MTRIALAIILAALPAPAFAWWDYGHRMIATIAAAELTPEARAEMQRLIAREALLETPGCPLASIEDASVWPDCVKALDERFTYAYNWHFQNVPICKPYDPKAACRDGNCVSAQIGRMKRLLANRRVPDRERLQALAFLVHFVGDMHQPLHAADNGDLGGNRQRADYGYKAPPRMNLHRIWDGEMAERALSTPPGGAAGLLSELKTDDRAAMAAGKVDDWAGESFAVSRDISYGALPLDRDICKAGPVQRPRVDEIYVAKSIPVMRLQVKRAGVRLGRLLNEALGEQAKPASTFVDPAE